MTYPVLKRHQIFVDIDRRHIAYWKSRENGISKVSPPPQRAAIHIYVSEVQSRQGAISHLRLLHGPKWLRVLALPIGEHCLLVVLGSRKNIFRARRPARSRSPSSEEIFLDPSTTRRHVVPCEPSSDDPVTGHIGQFCHRGCGSGAGGGIAITETCHQRCFVW